MSRDVELNVGINLQQLQADAAQAAQIFQQQFGKNVDIGTAASVTAIGAGQQQMHFMKGLQSAISQMTDAVKQLVQNTTEERQERSRKPKFAPDDPNRPYKRPVRTVAEHEEEEREKARRQRSRYLANNATHIMNAAGNVAQSGFSAGSMWRAGGQIAGMFGPWGLAAGSAMHFAGAMADKEYELGEGRMRMWRAGGNAARREFTNQTTGSIPIGYGWRPGSIQEMGLTGKQYENLMHQLLQKTGSFDNSMDVAKLEAGYGQGGGAAEMLGALKRSGSEAGRKELGQAIGLYLAQGLERGRVGETFTMLAHIAQSTISKVVDTGAEAKTLSFIGGMGPGYQGDTPKAHHALQALERMSKGEGTAVNRMMALRQAGLGSGKSYWEANLDVSKGLEDKRSLLGRYVEMPDIKKAWMSGTAEGKAKAANILSMYAGVEPWLAERFLEGYFSGKGVDDVTKGRDQQISDAFNVKPSEYDRKSVDAQNRKDLMARETLAPGYGAKVANTGGTGGLDNPAPTGGMPALPGRSPGGTSPAAVSSISEARKLYGDNFGQERARGTHESVDIKLPPGSPVHLAVEGVVKAIGGVAQERGGGFFLDQAGDDGRMYKYVHLKDRPSLQVGKKYPAGTFIGITLTTNHPGGSKSHLHLSVRDQSGKAMNPYEALGKEGFNRMIGANQVQAQAAIKNQHLVHQTHASPGISPGRGGLAGMDLSGLVGGGGASSAPVKQTVTHRFEITVREGQRSTITRSANRGQTAPGQMVTTTVKGDL